MRSWLKLAMLYGVQCVMSITLRSFWLLLHGSYDADAVSSFWAAEENSTEILLWKESRQRCKRQLRAG